MFNVEALSVWVGFSFKNKEMRIAGVGVNEKCLPSKEQLIEQALKTRAYFQMPRKKAIELINKEIKASGLFKSTVKRVKKSDINASGSSRLPNARKRSVDKTEDKG